MAAGLGSRFGGDKQVISVGPSGEMLMEYSIYDAIRAGFNKVVFILKEAMVETVRQACGDSIARFAEVHYAVQDYSDLPSWYQIPAARVKPFGTVHAVLSARQYVTEPFAVLNADDYYGYDAFVSMHEALLKLHEGEAAMVAYRLGNTMSENGTVTRGVCKCTADGWLESVDERHNLSYNETHDIRDGDTETVYSPQEAVSMNFWGFLPSVFDAMQSYFENFLHDLAPENIKGECLLPVMVNDMLHAKKMQVKVYTTDAVWFGMTYREDYDPICRKLRELADKKVYPENLRQSQLS